MRKIIAIGGLDPDSTLKDIEEEMIRVSSKSRPNILYIPTAANDNLRNFNTQKKIFKEEYDCDTTALLLVDTCLNKSEIRKIILDSDIIFIGGGSVSNLMHYINKYDLESVFDEASERGIVLTGMSAGGLCWGNVYLNIDDENHVTVIPCMSKIPFHICPHYNKEGFQQNVSLFENYILKENKRGIGLDNNCSIEFVDDGYRIISSKADSNAYILYNKDNHLIKKVIRQNNQFRSIEELLAD